MQLEDPTPKFYGLLAEFDSATAIVNAARKARDAGYVKVDAYTPFPIHELDDALRLPRTKLPWIVLAGGLTGMLAGFGLRYWASAIAYPMNVGGRPYASWPAFVVPAYETTILFASITAVVAMILFKQQITERYTNDIWPVIFPAAALLALIAAWQFVRRRDMFRAFISSSAMIALLIISAAIGIYPNLLISTTDPAYNLTVTNASSADNTLVVTLIVAIIGLPFVLLYTTGVYYIFRGKVTVDPDGY